MLEIKNLNVFYGKVHVLKDISLRLEDGQCITLLGSNGAGKSTLINAISGLVPSSGGSIQFDGREIVDIQAYQIVRLGISQVPEGRQIFANMSVMDNLRLGSYSRAGSTAKSKISHDIDRVMEMFPRLKERSSQLSGTLSGGEQQMLAIGRALMFRPKLLCIDEPSTGLAPILRSEVFRKIEEICEMGITVLLVEQEVSTVFKMASRNYVLSSGKIIAEGSGEELLADEVIRKTYLGL